MAAKKSSKKMSMKTKVAIGAGAVALAAATYYFFGPEGKKHRKVLKGWMIKMKGEIVEKMESAKEVSEQAYHDIVDAVASKYKGNVSAQDVAAFVAGLKKQWKGFAASSVSSTKRAGMKKGTRPQKKAASKKKVKKAAR